MTELDFDAAHLNAILSDRVLATETLTPEDWQRILALAQIHSVTPMLHARVRERKVALPPLIAQELAKLFLINVSRNAHLLFELGRILRALQDSNISVIPLKGAYFAEGVYGNAAWRQIGDLDLLVKPADLSRALDVLNSLGYFARVPFDIESECQLSQHMPHLYSPARVQLELHWTISSPWLDVPFDDYDFDQIWTRAMPVQLSGVNTLMLSPADSLLYLCMHAAVQHRFDGIGLRSFWDMALLIRRYGAALDWKRFIACTNEWGIANGVQLVLQLLQEWTDATIPTFVPSALNSAPANPATLDRIRQRVLSRGTVPLSVFNDASAAEKARPGDILIAVRNVLFPSRLVLAEEYHVPANSWRIPFYYLVRVKDLWLRNPRALRQVLERDKKIIEMQQELDLREYLD
jgi:Uncharacterised nucleotidyltransferase